MRQHLTCQATSAHETHFVRAHILLMRFGRIQPFERRLRGKRDMNMSHYAHTMLHARHSSLEEEFPYALVPTCRGVHRIVHVGIRELTIAHFAPWISQAHHFDTPSKCPADLAGRMCIGARAPALERRASASCAWAWLRVVSAEPITSNLMRGRVRRPTGCNANRRLCCKREKKCARWTDHFRSHVLERVLARSLVCTQTHTLLATKSTHDRLVRNDYTRPMTSTLRKFRPGDTCQGCAVSRCCRPEPPGLSSEQTSTCLFHIPHTNMNRARRRDAHVRHIVAVSDGRPIFVHAPSTAVPRSNGLTDPHAVVAMHVLHRDGQRICFTDTTTHKWHPNMHVQHFSIAWPSIWSKCNFFMHALSNK